MGLSDSEARVCAEIARREADLVALVSDLIRFDTVTHAVGDPPRQEATLQAMIAERLRAAGAAVKVWEPDIAPLAGHAMVPDGFDFAGRPQLLARFAGAGGGRTLLLCGHVDVVDVEPRDRWEHDPFDPQVQDGVLHGRGACDMKGGVGSMIVAAEALAALGITLAGDLLVSTVTEEESTGAGGLALARTVRADGAIVPEPSGFDVWVACRGSLLPTIEIEGRAGHAGIAPRPPEDGGPVNAIEKLGVILDAIRRLRERWANEPRHPFLSPGDCVPTIVAGGEWLVSYPAACRLECHIEYLPGRADADGYGSLVAAEFEAFIREAAAIDPWLAEHPPRISWNVGGVPPAEVAVDDPVVVAALGATAAVGRPGRIAGLDNWHDGATLTVEAGIPAICLGPGDIHLAHTATESVPVAELVACAQALAVTAMRFCSTVPA